MQEYRGPFSYVFNPPKSLLTPSSIPKLASERHSLVPSDDGSKTPPNLRHRPPPPSSFSTTADVDGCPYPCYPPPTGGIPTTPPVQTGFNYYPPPAFEYSTGNLPNYPPPSWYGGQTTSPPPPDPILPYWPYYFKGALDHSSSKAADRLLLRSPAQILLAILVISVLC